MREVGVHSKIKENFTRSYSVKRLLYTLCFFMFCVINQRVQTCSPLEGGREVFRNLSGVVMAIIIMSHYKLKDFRDWKVPYLIWSIVGAVAAIIYYIFGEPMLYFSNARIVGALDIFLFGYILIHTFISVFCKNDMPKLNRKFFSIWLLMMALMIVSRSNYIWPFCYLIMFGGFYLTNFTEDEKNDLIQGALDGIILSLFVFQGWCCVFRPYDVVQYIGVFSNPNNTALYYLFVLAAVFAKIVCLTKYGGSKWLKLFYWLGEGVVYALLFLTIGRTAWVTSFVLGIYFLWAMKKLQQKKNVIRNSLAILLSFCIMFPVVFGLIRYLPPVFHHPVWFFGEWSEWKVHSWDDWNSDKYTDLDEFLPASLGRVSDIVGSIIKQLPFAITAEASAPAEKTAEERYADMLEQGYALSGWDTLDVRSTIYRYYADHLNLFGHPYEEQGFQMTPYYWIGHAHNIFLQYGTDFGIIVMALFIFLTIAAIISFGKLLFMGISGNILADQLLFIITVLFGLFEYSWEVGGLGSIMMFVTWRELFIDGNK